MVVPWTPRRATIGAAMSDTKSVVSLFLTPHLSVDLSPLEAEVVTGETDIRLPDEQIAGLTVRLKPYATKVLAAIAACHGRTQAVVLSRAALCVLQCAELIYPNTSFMVLQATQGKAISLVPGRQGYCLVATGATEGTLFGLTIMCEKDTHFFPINDDVANTKVAADIASQVLKAAHAPNVMGEAAGVSQAELTVKVELTKDAGKAAALAQANLADKVRILREEEAKRVAAGPKSASERKAERGLYLRRCVVLAQIRRAVDALKACGGDDATEWAARELMIIASFTDKVLFDKWCRPVGAQAAGAR